MISFKEYASEKQILELLIKERVKVALKSKLQNISPGTVIDKFQEGERLTISEHITLLMPLEIYGIDLIKEIDLRKIVKKKDLESKY